MIKVMVDSDSAFLWETEALRGSNRERERRQGTSESRELGASDWLTLRDASARTGIPVSTLRKWARRDAIPSYLEDTPQGQYRMVSLRGVRRRARDLGREVEGMPSRATPPVSYTVRTSPSVDLDRELSSSAQAPSAQPEVPEGTMLVPLDAWNKMLNQLGNLHEAGQQLAEARERAAKAETEARFLRERLAELRADVAETRGSGRQRHVTRVDEPMEPLTHIPIESAESDETRLDEDAEAVDIPVRDLGKPEPTPEAGAHEKSDEEELLSLATYSMEMAKHLYSTWRRRPRR